MSKLREAVMAIRAKSVTTSRNPKAQYPALEQDTALNRRFQQITVEVSASALLWSCRASFEAGGRGEEKQIVVSLTVRPLAWCCRTRPPSGVATVCASTTRLWWRPLEVRGPHGPTGGVRGEDGLGVTVLLGGVVGM